ncbi:hypothetical protein UCDDS831_g02461 [Diplodia seriata]|uniref:Uncharacterized protein n=1 Tax=Diplodia seriata TaxID=420778 RepID=A0A0G2GLU1_9PEZI|nr:hypothetical protein UCDDS831_g02461 [Diplodia seriata]
MPPPKRRQLATARSTTPLKLPTAVTPVEPCTNKRCHFHRLRCGHVVKTSLTQLPTACATNCMTAPATGNATDTFGAAPFECPVCVARTLCLLWKMDVVNLRRQLPTLDYNAYVQWVQTNYVRAWEQRRRVRIAAWMGPEEARRECWQPSMRERALVVWEKGEQRAPYAIEEFRRVYERRDVHPDFWNQTYKDNTLDGGSDEAEPGVVYGSVERPGVDFPLDWAA